MSNDSSEKALFKIVAELEQRLTMQTQHMEPLFANLEILASKVERLEKLTAQSNDEYFHNEIKRVNERIDGIMNSSVYDFVHNIENNTFDEINVRLLKLEASKQDANDLERIDHHGQDIDSMKDQIDLNSAQISVTRKELEKGMKTLTTVVYVDLENMQKDINVYSATLASYVDETNNSENKLNQSINSLEEKVNEIIDIVMRHKENMLKWQRSCEVMILKRLDDEPIKN